MSAGPERQEVAFLVCFAVKEEAAWLTPNSMRKTVITGMGRRNASTRFTETLNRFNPERVITCGFAGALNPALKIADVLFDEDFDAGLGERLRAAGAVPAKFYCATRVAVTAAEKAELWRATGADAIEMESAVIRTLCRERKIPSATLRVISDTANEDLPLDFNALMTSEQKISIPRLIGKLIRSPGSVPRLLQLQRDTRFAARRLAAVLNDAMIAATWDGPG